MLIKFHSKIKKFLLDLTENLLKLQKTHLLHELASYQIKIFCCINTLKHSLGLSLLKDLFSLQLKMHFALHEAACPISKTISEF